VARVSEIDLDQAEAPVIYTIDGIGVHLGRRDWDERLTRLEGVLARLDETGERVDWIDLRFRDQVVLRPQGAPVTAGEPTRRAAARPPATAPRPESR
jgi:cell division septal protein FtsQ